MVSILRDVVKRGTARGINLKEIEIAGKTGTTNNNVDAWFCSFSPTIQVISWFGNDNNSRMKKSETGSRAAGTATKEFFKEFIEKYPTVKREFEIPENVITREIDGVQKLFTPTSKPPKVDLIQEDKLIF
jgi:penicillin-binding protein 1A